MFFLNLFLNVFFTSLCVCVRAEMSSSLAATEELVKKLQLENKRMSA